MENTNADDAIMNGKTLALTFGLGIRFVSMQVEMGSSEDDETQSMTVVYPERYAGMGGGMMAASMEEAPVFEFEEGGEDQAEELAAAFNYFAMEGRV